jgi:acetoin utilization deacetylase AcuC-like enzyme
MVKMAEHDSCAIVRDERYKDHIPDYPHVENAERLTVIYEALEEREIRGLWHLVEPRSATIEELRFIHTHSHIQRITATQNKNLTSLDADTQASALSYQVALLAVGGFLNLLEAIWRGNFQNGFALVRPPGHHAEADRAMGFCLFNNVAIGARYLTNVLGAKRVLIVDWDLHHGNGTQHSFEKDNDVLYFSIHQFPHYPGSGRHYEVGTGPGEGFTVNVPLSYGHGDETFIQIFTRLLQPIALQFKPGIILVSAGFDTHYLDPLGGLAVTESGFAILTRILKSIANTCCDGKLALTLEGGYHLGALKRSVKQVVLELCAEKDPDQTIYDLTEGISQQVAPEIERVVAIHRKYWDLP